MSFSGVSGRAVGAVDEGYLDQLAEPREVKTERIPDDHTVRGDEEDRQIGIDTADTGNAGEWVCADSDELGGAVAREQILRVKVPTHAGPHP